MFDRRPRPLADYLPSWVSQRATLVVIDGLTITRYAGRTITHRITLLADPTGLLVERFRTTPWLFIGASIDGPRFKYRRKRKRENYGEQRFNCLGLLEGRLVHITYTERGDVTRIISMRKANQNEQKTYFNKVRSKKID